MTTQFEPNTMSLPPPALDLELLDGARIVGWVRGRSFGFAGFANENEAAGAAWVAHRTIARRLARRQGGPAAPTAVEPLSLRQDGERTVILAGGQPIATLVRPGGESPPGTRSFGFEIQMPPPAGELSMRSLAYRIYHALRASGAPWERCEGPRVEADRLAALRQRAWSPTRSSGESSRAAIVFVAKFLLAAIAIVLGAAVIAAAPRTVTIPIGTVVAVGLVVSGLVAMIRRRRATRGRRPDRPGAATHRPDHSRLRADDASSESMREIGWLALGVVSLTVLVLALVVPTELGVAFAAIGLAGLVVFRLLAGWGGWPPQREARRMSPGRNR
ncbi:MAG: hypothetical protein M3303_11875 [Gemmatimonadota bacterium]|nr:hypothetical protein [Gemmatimonadota bacterium]